MSWRTTLPAGVLVPLAAMSGIVVERGSPSMLAFWCATLWLIFATIRNAPKLQTRAEKFQADWIATVILVNIVGVSILAACDVVPQFESAHPYVISTLNFAKTAISAVPFVVACVVWLSLMVYIAIVCANRPKDERRLDQWLSQLLPHGIGPVILLPIVVGITAGSLTRHAMTFAANYWFLPSVVGVVLMGLVYAVAHVELLPDRQFHIRARRMALLALLALSNLPLLYAAAIFAWDDMATGALIRQNLFISSLWILIGVLVFFVLLLVAATATWEQPWRLLDKCVDPIVAGQLRADPTGQSSTWFRHCSHMGGPWPRLLRIGEVIERGWWHCVGKVRRDDPSLTELFRDLRYTHRVLEHYETRVAALRESEAAARVDALFTGSTYPELVAVRYEEALAAWLACEGAVFCPQCGDLLPLSSEHRGDELTLRRWAIDEAEWLRQLAQGMPSLAEDLSSRAQLHQSAIADRVLRHLDRLETSHHATWLTTELRSRWSTPPRQRLNVLLRRVLVRPPAEFHFISSHDGHIVTREVPQAANSNRDPQALHRTVRMLLTDLRAAKNHAATAAVIDELVHLPGYTLAADDHRDAGEALWQIGQRPQAGNELAGHCRDKAVTHWFQGCWSAYLARIQVAER